jgi:hypothetical protein
MGPNAVYVVYMPGPGNQRLLVDEPNEFVTMDAAYMRSERVEGSDFIPVSWEEADRLKKERWDRLYPPEPEFCLHCGLPG